MRSIVLLLTAIFFWALNFHLGKIMLEYVSPNVAAFWRFLFGMLGLLLISYSSLPSWQIIKKHWRGLALVGFVGLFGFIYLFTQGLDKTSAVNGSLIIALNPAMTLILIVLFQRHPIRKREVAGIVLALVGVLYLILKGNLSRILEITLSWGDLYFLGASLMFALHNIWVKRFATAMGTRPFTFLTNLACLSAFLVLYVIESPVGWTELPTRFWLAALGMGLLGTSLSYYTWNAGLRAVGPAKGAIFFNTLPLMVAILAIPFGASLFLFHLVSFVLIVSGLLIMQLDWQRLL